MIKRLLIKLSDGLSFKRKMFWGLLLVALIPGIASASLLVNVFKNRIESDYEKEAAKQVDAVVGALSDYIESIDTTLIRIMADDRIIGNIYETDSWEKNKAYTRLYEITQDIRNIASFKVYDKSGKCIFTTSSGPSKDMPVYWGILKTASVHPEKMIVRKAAAYYESDVLLQAARAVYLDEECVGFVVTDVNSSNFEAVLANSYDESNGISVLDSFYEEIYSTRLGNQEKLAETLRSRKFDGEEMNKDGDITEMFLRQVLPTDLYVVLGKEPVLTTDTTRTMWGVTIVIGFMSLLLCLIIASLSSAYLTAPIREMTVAMKRVREGDLNVSINSTRKDELGQLSNQFDKMTRDLNTYMELQAKQQREINDSNIAMMQAQLNPHFLYNTLDTMKWVAKANNVPQIAKLSADLAQILRMSISDSKFVTLAEEMELVEKYAEIQQIRFGGNFTFDVELPMELEDCIVPKLIVQPIVENALIHGLKEQDKGHIFVNIYELHENLNIEVSDNGCGIEEDVIEKLNSHDREKLRGHIGFFNVDTIIKLYYGNDYGLEACRLSQGGTMIRIVLPINKEKIDE